jgi:hypothetical protein
VACLVLALVAAFPAAARASCGAEDCPIVPHARGARSLTFDLAWQYIDQDEVRVGTRAGAVGELPSPEDEVRTLSRTVTLTVQGRLGPRAGYALALPWVSRMHAHIANEEGVPPAPQEWHYAGLGDLGVLASLDLAGSDATPGTTRLTLELGGRAPTGRTEVPEVDGEQPEPPARPGTGAWSAIAGLHAMHTFMPRGAPLPAFASALGRFNAPGTQDYRVGPELQLTAGGSVALGGPVRFLAQLNARFRGKDDAGATDALEANTGGTWLYATPGLSVALGRGLSGYAYGQWALYQDVNRIQITAPWHALAGLTFTPAAR